MTPRRFPPPWSIDELKAQLTGWPDFGDKHGVVLNAASALVRVWTQKRIGSAVMTRKSGV